MAGQRTMSGLIADLTGQTLLRKRSAQQINFMMSCRNETQQNEK